MQKRKVRWTYHALERAEEYGLSVKTLLESFSRSRKYQLSKNQDAYKFKKYGMDSLKFSYHYDKKEDLVFTCKSEELDIVITVTKGRGNVMNK